MVVKPRLAIDLFHSTTNTSTMPDCVLPQYSYGYGENLTADEELAERDNELADFIDLHGFISCREELEDIRASYARSIEMEELEYEWWDLSHDRAQNEDRRRRVVEERELCRPDEVIVVYDDDDEDDEDEEDEERPMTPFGEEFWEEYNRDFPLLYIPQPAVRRRLFSGGSEDDDDDGYRMGQVD